MPSYRHECTSTCKTERKRETIALLRGHVLLLTNEGGFAGLTA